MINFDFISIIVNSIPLSRRIIILYYLLLTSKINCVKIGDHLGTIAEPLRTVAHHFPPKLPPFAMLATFATFAVASRNFHPRRVYGLRIQLPPRLTRQPTHLVLVASMLQQHLSCIRPKRLYKPALLPS